MIRLAVQRALERGMAPTLPTMLLSRLWEKSARVTKRLVVRKPVLCVSGATLGGSNRTPLAIACARYLREHGGLRVALVGHAYRARPPRVAVRVDANDDPRVVGDEAIECTRAGVTVFVARSRQRAIDAAELDADVLVLDGPLQLESRATLSLLAVDRDAPWGSGKTPPLGNLRASRAALERAADAIVTCTPSSRGVHVRGELIQWSALPKRVGLTTGIARPERVLALLRANGVEPARVLYSADHTPLRFDRTPVDVWLTTSKDAARGAFPCENVGVIDCYLDLPKDVAVLLRSRFSLRF